MTGIFNVKIIGRYCVVDGHYCFMQKLMNDKLSFQSKTFWINNLVVLMAAKRQIF